MGTKEILCLTLLFIFCFMITEFLVGQLFLYSAIQRLFVRVGFQIQFYSLIYLFFDSFDITGRIKKLEKLHREKTPGDDGNISSEAEGS